MRGGQTAQRVMHAAAQDERAADDAFLKAAERVAHAMLHRQERKQAERDLLHAYIAKQRAGSLPLGRAG